MGGNKKEIGPRTFMKGAPAAPPGFTVEAATSDRSRARSAANPYLADLSLADLSRMVRRGEITSKRLVEEHLERITKFDGREGLNAYITVMGEAALKQAEELDKLGRAKSFKGPLHGMPIAVKDNLDTQGVRTTGGTKVLADWRPRRDGHVIQKLKDAGAIILGKTNMHGLAFGVTTNNPHYGPTRNPYDSSRIPGGSSGGSAAAVAAGFCAGALGSDTGGSVRIPAALCGVVGFKPSFGRVGRGGLLYLSFSRDVIGPITRSVVDAALILEAISGPDPRDPESSNRPVPHYATGLKGTLKNKRFGVPKNLFFDTIHSDTRRVFDDAVRQIERMGGIVKEVKVRSTDLLKTQVVQVLSEWIFLIEDYLKAFDPHATVDKYLDQFGPDVKAILGTQKGLPDSRPVPGYVYVKTMRESRLRIAAAFEEAMRGLDALLVPTTVMPAPKIGEDIEVNLEGKKLPTMPTFTKNTNPFNVINYPAITVPAGYSREGLPIGVQIVMRPWEDAKLLSIAYVFERATNVRRAPEL
jgi:Asp-tRNA(Asn)/Glu-tRNA(Gln) amidotransferase A subunit family amidase